MYYCRNKLWTVTDRITAREDRNQNTCNSGSDVGWSIAQFSRRMADDIPF
jgi:hypothetical protein